MKKTLLALTCAVLLSTGFLRADEGMWIPLLLEQLNEKEMQEMGMRISAEDIYSINKSSLKDAIVHFGGGCTGEVVSDQGLLLTNHHCGYGRIQSHSTLDNDYLTDGFWAMDKSEELPNPGLTVTFLVRMEDVSEKVLDGVETGMTEAQRDEIIKQNSEKLIDEATNDTHYNAYIRPFYYGNEYYLFITEIFKDVRLVGAPPSNIGKFGGDTDNWMWPRHTGDFSIFRIYADSNNKPAAYSENNVPYKPKYHIPISLKGVDEGDFTFVFGYPGRTQEYLPSNAIELITGTINPIRIKCRADRLDIFKKHMDKDKLVRIQYSAKTAGIANGWKKWIGENRGIKRLNAVEKKQNFEADFAKWVSADNNRKVEYGGILNRFDEIYDDLIPLEIGANYLIEAGIGIEIVRYANGYRNLVTMSEDKDNKDAVAEEVERLKGRAKGHFKNYHLPIDKEVFVKLMNTYLEGCDPLYMPAYLLEMNEKYKGDMDAFANDVFSKSFMTSETDVNAFLDTYKASKRKKILKDPAYKLASEMVDFYYSKLAGTRAYYNEVDSLMRLYMRAQMEMKPDHRFYPDANSTIRVHYGNVKTYKPRNAVTYHYFTTLDGIMQKENPDIYDYVVEDKLKELYETKDYGVYADKDGTMHVCFIAANHTTGGNSGSPLLDADGNLLGLNFDRNWEGTMSDLMYDPDQCRNITIDIRYALFIIDKFAGAGHLVEEMTLIK